MRLIKPSCEIIPQASGLEGIYQQIEKAGRVCYKSENRITEDSAKEFVDKMIKSGHGAMLEHGTVYLSIPDNASRTIIIKGTRCSDYISEHYLYNKYSKVVTSEHISGTTYYVTTNLRVLVEYGWLDDLKYLCEPTEHHEKRATVKFVCSRGIWNEFIRHKTLQRIDDCETCLVVDYDMERKCSFAQESTRYCNYSKDKFDNQVTFILPSWVDTDKFYKHSIINIDEEGSLISEYYFHLTGKETDYFKPWEITKESNFKAGLEISEQLYLELLQQGCTPQQARDVLPIALKTELVMTGFISDWEHFFELRCDKKSHPDAQVLANELKNKFIEKGWIIQ